MVSDDASSDRTVEVAASVAEPRVRVIQSPRRGGIASNWNRAIRAARGEYIKLLMQDDLLEVGCVSSMAAVLERNPTIGFVFSTRTVLLGEPSDPRARRWRERYGTLHGPLEPLSECNDGQRLFDAMRRLRFRLNCFGEPSAVMVRRAAFEQVGLFAGRMPQLLDEEMWLRLAFFFDVGFVPRPLVSIRVHAASATNRNSRDGTAWLDPLWLVEGLRQHPEMRTTITPRTELVALWWTIASEARRARRMGPLGLRSYAHDLREYRQFRNARPQRTLHETFDEAENPDL